MTWALVTATEVRHRHVANRLAAAGLIRAVVAEPKAHDPATRHTNDVEQRLLERYFADRTRSERDILADGPSWNLGDDCELITVKAGGANESHVPAEVERLGVQGCVVFGSSILKQGWLGRFGGSMVNLHLGLSPYYRGAGTNFWALHDGKPQLVGATIHVLDAGVDTGPILMHVRPNPLPGDNAHSFGNNTIAKAARALVDLLPRWETIEPVPQWSEPSARECRMKDFDAPALTRMLERLDRGLLRDYAAAPAAFEQPRLVREFEPLVLS